MILRFAVFAATASDSMAVLATMTEVMVACTIHLSSHYYLTFLPRPRYYFTWPSAEVWMGIIIKEHKRLLVVEVIEIPL